MAYQPNIPAATDAISQSQVDLQANFQQLNVGFAIDHNAYDAASPGQHKKVLFTNVAADPAIVNPAGQLYTKSVTGVIEAFFSNGTTVTQLTGLPQTLAGKGTLTLGGGLIFKWGTIPGNGTNEIPVLFLPEIANFPNNVYNIQLTADLNDTTAKSFAVKSGSASVTGFTIKSSTTSVANIYWFAIGN